MAQNKAILRPKQKRAILALLDGKNIADAAAACGVARCTLTRWLADPLFRAELARAEGELIDQATRRLANLQAPAIRTIAEIVNDDSGAPGVRLRAAQGVIDILIKLRELRNIEERLAELEKNVYGFKRN